MTRLKKSKKEIISYKMSRVKAKGTGIEKIMGHALWASGLRGYRKNQKSVLGTPDFCWKRRKIAVFCDSSFWHGYNWLEEKEKIKVRKDFWFKKIEDNMRRDKAITLRLKQDGWKVFRFWDFEIKKDASACVNKIAQQVAAGRRAAQLTGTQRRSPGSDTNLPPRSSLLLPPSP